MERSSEGTDISRLTAQLSALQTHVESIPQVEQPPLNSMEILGNSRSEEAWEAMLVYFLNSDRPHGLGTAVLSAFLEAIEAHPETAFVLRRYDLSRVEISSQVSAEDGVPDVLLWVEDEWFICLELKVRAAETDEQTVRYSLSSRLGGLDVDDYSEADRHYVYLAPGSSRDATADRFIDVSWEHVIPHLRQVLVDAQGRYPVRSQAQLAEFIDTIRSELGMTEYTEHNRDRALLHIKYSDAINAVSEAFDEMVDAERDAWQDDFDAVMDQDDRRWISQLSGRKYAQAFLPEWVYFEGESRLPETKRDGTMSVIYGCELDRASFERGELRLGFKSVKHDDDALRDHVDRHLTTRIDAVASEFAVTMLPDNRQEIFEYSVPFDLEAGHSAGRQFAKGILELEELNGLLTGFFNEAVEEY